MKRGQISFEYIMIMGFVTFVLIGILSFAFIYGSEIQDKVRISQTTNYGNQLISAAESVFYAREPSKITIEAYLPDNINNLTIEGDSVVLKLETSTGIDILVFDSQVPISGNLSYSKGLKRIELVASSGEVVISQV